MENVTSDCLPIGTTLKGRSYQYRIERVLGQGTFGITYLATVRIEGALGALDLNVALKEFFMHDINGRSGTSVTSVSQHGLFEEYKKKFVREANNLSKLRHPNIVKVLESFEANGTVYYSMDYINGGSLDDHITSKGKLSEQECVRLACQICSGLNFMHEHRMLHLDLKPLNIMLNKGEAVLIDFGLSKQYDDNGEPESSTTVGRGTKGYAPLEQSDYQEGNGFPVTMDIYAFGATVFKMLTGHRPPDASHILNQGFPAADLQGVGVSPWLIELIRKCMAPTMVKRPQYISDVLSVLESKSPQDDIKVEVVYPPDSDETVFGVSKSIAPKPIVPKPAAPKPAVPKPTAPKPTTGIINGHEYVDLGLSVKWATCNVGANSPSDYGDYFAWGETSPKANYVPGNSASYNKKYKTDIAGDASHDAARANWGGSWRLPTASEIDELVNKCQWTWITKGGHKGYKVTGPNGNSIFFPAAGYRLATGHGNVGEYGNYWSATPLGSDTQKAYRLTFHIGIFYRYSHLRCLGFSVRAVSE